MGTHACGGYAHAWEEYGLGYMVACMIVWEWVHLGYYVGVYMHRCNMPCWHGSKLLLGEGGSGGQLHEIKLHQKE